MDTQLTEKLTPVVTLLSMSFKSASRSVLMMLRGHKVVLITRCCRYFRYIAEEDTRSAETSPAACKALVALEFSPNEEEKAQYKLMTEAETSTGANRKARDETPNFWKRVDAVFAAIDALGNGDGTISRDELVAHFRGNTLEADYYMLKMDGFIDANTDEAPDGLLTIQEWHEYFRYMSEADTGVPETSASACKALSAIEYAKVVHSTGHQQKASAVKTHDFWFCAMFDALHVRFIMQLV